MSPTTLAYIGTDLAALALLVGALYLPRHGRRDLTAACIGGNIGVLAVTLLLSTASVGAGLGLGLFGVLSIIRLRSTEISQGEIAYFFASLALGLLGGIQTAPPALVATLMALVVASLWIGDNPRLVDDVAPPERARRLAQALEPVLITRYERTTLHLPGESARLTLDTRLAWIGLPPRGAPADGRAGGADGHGGRVGDSGGGVGRAGGAGAGRRHVPVRAAGALAIVETKTPAAPSAADRWLWAAGHRPAVVSKYATGMALLHPELPANKWHRALTHELAAA